MKSKKQNILIVDDGIDISIVLKDFISNLGYNVTSVDNGDDAIDLVKKNNFDLILLDLAMPKLDGIEVLKKIKEEKKDAKVIIITAYRDAEKIVEAFRNGASDCLFKPFDLRVLKKILSKKTK